MCTSVHGLHPCLHLWPESVFFLFYLSQMILCHFALFFFFLHLGKQKHNTLQKERKWNERAKQLNVTHFLGSLPSQCCLVSKGLTDTCQVALPLNWAVRSGTIQVLYLQFNLMTLGFRTWVNSHPSASVFQIFTWISILFKCKIGPAVSNWDIQIQRKWSIKWLTPALCPKGKWETF